MVNMEPIMLQGHCLIGLEIAYPKTKLLSITVPNVGYLMCGVLNINALDTLHLERGIVAARAVGVKTLQDLLEAKIVDTTIKGSKIGIQPGMTGAKALECMLAADLDNQGNN